MRVVDESLGVVDRPSVGVVDEMGSSMMMISSWTLSIFSIFQNKTIKLTLLTISTISSMLLPDIQQMKPDPAGYRI